MATNYMVKGMLIKLTVMTALISFTSGFAHANTERLRGKMIKMAAGDDNMPLDFEDASEVNGSLVLVNPSLVSKGGLWDKKVGFSYIGAQANTTATVLCSQLGYRVGKAQLDSKSETSVNSVISSDAVNGGRYVLVKYSTDDFIAENGRIICQ
ncbi:MAG: hypothetical protein ACXWRE_01685 [Pseudobdellovibrionaceae bacterium]